MIREIPCEQMTFGYLSTVESADHGFFGGYLLISPQGRPLEFHCTAPIRPSRAQQILYGPTLRTYLLGEQIGGTLLASAKLKPQVVLTDQLDVLCLRSHAGVPLVLLDFATGLDHDATSGGYSPCGSRADPAGDDGARATSSRDAAPSGELSAVADDSLRRFSIDGYPLELPAGFESDRAAVLRLLGQLAAHVDLAEPFGRIHEAIREAQRIATQHPEQLAGAGRPREQQADGQAA